MTVVDTTFCWVWKMAWDQAKTGTPVSGLGTVWKFLPRMGAWFRDRGKVHGCRLSQMEGTRRVQGPSRIRSSRALPPLSRALVPGMRKRLGRLPRAER